MMCINFNIEITNPKKKKRFNIEIEDTKGKEK